MPEDIVVDLPDEAATLSLGASLSKFSGIIFLNGELGAGKTTLVRGYLQALGYEGAVKSPTYTLIEPYEIAGRRLLHLDIYRLGDPLELEALAIRDELDPDNTLLVEWPERAQGYLGEPDIEINLLYNGDARQARIVAKVSLARQIAKVISGQ
jgi:tRNA threonylcarbamoyladenosine biosynthesis protein TsaE